MPHYEAKMGENGEVVIPENIRHTLKLKHGDLIDFYTERDGRTIRMIARNRELSELQGLVKNSGEPIDIDAAIGAYLSEKYDRINRKWIDEFRASQKSTKSDAAE